MVVSIAKLINLQILPRWDGYDNNCCNINVSFSYAEVDLKELIQINENKKTIKNHLKNQGYKKEDMEVKNINIIDKQKYYEMECQNGQEVQVKIDR